MYETTANTLSFRYHHLLLFISLGQGILLCFCNRLLLDDDVICFIFNSLCYRRENEDINIVSVSKNELVLHFSCRPRIFPAQLQNNIMVLLYIIRYLGPIILLSKG